MLFLKYLLLTSGFGMLAGAAAVIAYDVFRATRLWRLRQAWAEGSAESRPDITGLRGQQSGIRYTLAAQLAGGAILPLLLSFSIAVVPSGFAAVRVSQISGTRPGTLYPGVHFIMPLIETIAVYDVRDRIFTTTSITQQTDIKAGEKPKGEILRVQAREGLPIGLAITVRYRLDAGRLDYVNSSLPQPVEQELVPPVVASVFRQLVPNYTVREVFATKREEIRNKAVELITAKLGSDAIVVKEVMLRDIELPVEYARGLEGLLLKEQENERLLTEVEIKQKQVRTAELEAEAFKVRDIKKAEADSQVRVLQAKAESDAMQYTLPLKLKQIDQSRLEAAARKESTVKNAEAAAEAKVIDSKAELEKRNLLASAEANRIRVTASADAERMKLEALVLKQNPLLIQKIIAERLSDKLQIMMVPSDGKFFFANDVFRGMNANLTPQDDDPPPPPPRKPEPRP
ncbi:MAG: prohibitin family protein [Acidobacteria bacterium]|nr:prohibitin family protein [Acidobacteriota bacterium]